MNLWTTCPKVVATLSHTNCDISDIKKGPARYEKRSTILTTNINFNSWDDVFYDPVIANAILDRILHHAHVINITGKSYRLREYMIQDDE